MAGMRKNKRGIFFSLSFFILMMIVLALAILIFHNTEQSKERVEEFGRSDRLYNLYTSIENSFRDLFNEKSGITINIDNSIVSFKEDLPNGNAQGFINYIGEFKNFIESNYSNVKLDVEKISNGFPLSINPYNFVYQHNEFGNNQIEIISNHQNIDTYSILITTTEDINIDSCKWEIVPGSLSLTIQVTSPGGSCGDTKLVDPNQENKVNIKEGSILIELNSNLLQITESNEEVEKINVETIATFKPSDEQIKVEYNDALNITFYDLGITKEGSIRVL